MNGTTTNYYFLRSCIGSQSVLGSLVWAAGRAMKINKPITGKEGESTSI